MFSKLILFYICINYAFSNLFFLITFNKFTTDDEYTRYKKEKLSLRIYLEKKYILSASFRIFRLYTKF